MKKLCLFTWLLFLFGVSAFAQVGGSGTANTVAKFTASTTIGNSGITDNGTTVSTGEAISLTGTSYPNLFHQPVSYTSLGIQGQPSAAPWQIFYGNTTTPITANHQDIFAEIVSNSGSSGTMPAAIRAYALQSAGTANTAAIEGVCQANTGNGSGTGCTTIHAVGSAGAASVGVFALWAQTYDNGNNAGQTGVEIDTNTTLASRTYGQLRGMNIVNFPGTGTTSGSSGDVTSDWGALIEGYGYGLVLSPSTPPYNAAARRMVWVRNSGNATVNANTTLLGIEGSQPGPFNYGLDFRNATFANTSGCCAITTASSTLSQFGRVGTVSGTNDLAGQCAFSASTTCTVTFTNAYTNNPFCVANFVNGPVAAINAAANGTTLTLTAAASNSNTAYFICVANQD